MQVNVLFLGPLKEMAGASNLSVEVQEGETVEGLLRLIQGSVPGLKAYSKSMAISVNQEYASVQTILHDQDEVGLLPPVSGGSGKSDRAFIVREKIESEKIVSGLKAPQDGAVVVFEGIVRDNSRGRRTVYLEYEAYVDMAVRQLTKLVEEAISQFRVRDAVIHHRIGKLYIGETSVLIVVASAHRAAAFEACRWIIDQLKKTVPIWKKEYFEDGAVWADGEPFPADVDIAGETRTGSAD